MPVCINCFNPIDEQTKFCPYCNAAVEIPDPINTPHGDIHVTYDPTGKDSSAAIQASFKQISALTQRYRDAYIVARATNGFGGVIKGIGLFIGGVLAIGGFMVASNGGPRDPNSVLGIVAIVVGVIAGALFYIIGVLVSAQGQILKASIDGAVNNSPFLTNQYRAKIMSLPEA
jgi:hypothetical protein